MRIIEDQQAEIWEQKPGIEGMYEQIERAARVCYQSQALIKEGSAEKIVKALIKNNHTAMLEHGTVYMTVPALKEYEIQTLLLDDDPAKYTETDVDDDFYYITTNYRVIVEHNLEKLMKKYWSEPTEMHAKRRTVFMTTNIQVATEYIRHRVMSFAMESTRYCSYDNEKFGNEITFILPCWLKDPNASKLDFIEWANAMQDCENHYMRLRDRGWTAQQCAQVLPKATKTALVMTGFDDYFDHFFDLRHFEKTGKAHPQAKELATIIYNLMHP